MFSLSDSPLDPQALKEDLRSSKGGACVTFEGWVRNHNDGREVVRLQYEAYAEVAVAEGLKILEDALRKFDILEARCIHRVGTLEIGDIAVWIGVSAAHREEAFAACRFIIDEIKHRCPIWKKEHYSSGDSGWVNNEDNAASRQQTLPAINERQYYDRQLRLKEIGESGQSRLRESKVLVVGAGGLGSPALLYLASAGVGHLGICESDSLEADNLHRQVIFSHRDIGKSKAELAAARIKELNPFVVTHLYNEPLTTSNAKEIISHYDLVLDCSDNFPTKFLINDVAVLSGIPAVFASIYQYEGQVQLYDSKRRTPCLRCLWPVVPEEECLNNCAEAGILGATAGIIGTMQAMETIKLILDLPGVLEGEMLIYDTLAHSLQKIWIPPVENCPVCGTHPAIKDISPENYTSMAGLELDVEQLDPGELKQFNFIDVRESDTTDSAPFNETSQERIAYTKVKENPSLLERDGKYLLFCNRGVKSIFLTKWLRENGYKNVFSVRGGIPALKKILD